MTGHPPRPAAGGFDRHGTSTTCARVDVDVVVVGGGPVGLALAAELGWRGVSCRLVERRDGSVGLPRMNGVNTRTMEICRRWGIAQRVRDAGWPGDFPRRMLYVTSLTGYELHRLDLGLMGPGGQEATSPEHFQRCSQMWFDPILAEFAASFSTTELRYRTELERFVDAGDHVTAQVRNVATGQTERITAHYLVGCDGGRSTVRDLLGIEMDGSRQLSREVSVYFRSDAPITGHDKGRAVMVWLIGPDGMWGALSAIDGRTLWRLWISQLPGDVDAAGLDGARYVRAALGTEAPFEIVGIVPWLRQQLVAREYRRGRVFLAGDAVHTLTPTGGFGMNTGIGDAVDLAWKLSGVLAGWADPRMLDSYEVERRPVGVRNVNEATFTFAKFLEIPRMAALLDDSAAGEVARSVVARHLAENEFEREFRNEGIVLGYRYDDSPICVPDGSPTPPDDAMRYVPTARPGARAPHVVLSDGRSTLDLFGRGYTLLALGRTPPPVGPLVTAAAGRGLPLTVVSLPDADVLELYERRLVLVRPDGHVAWRADEPPGDPVRLVDHVRAAAPLAPRRSGEDVAAGEAGPGGAAEDDDVAGLEHEVGSDGGPADR